MNISFVAIFLRLIFGIKYALFIYGIEAFEGLNGIKRLGLRMASVLISLGQVTITKLIKEMPGVEFETFIIGGTVDSNRFDIKVPSKELKDKFGLQNEKVLMTVARLSAEEKLKGYDIVLQALKILVDKNVTAKYLLIGGGDDTPRVRALAQTLGLQDLLILTGDIPNQELPDYYALSDIYVMPARGEGFGVVFLEALCCGKPVIAGNLDGSRDALLDGEVGLLVNPRDPQEVAEAIRRVLTLDVPKHFLDGGELRRKALDAFGRDRFEGRMVQLFHRIRELQNAKA